MAKPEKQAAIAEIADEFSTSAGAVLTEYRGLTVKELKELRRSFGGDATYAVVKNTLTKIAAKQAGVEGLDDLLNGPTAIAFIKGDVVATAKGLRDFAKANPHLVIKGGFYEGKPLSASEVDTLANLESREVLLAKLAGAMLATLSQALYVFNALPSKAAQLMAALEAKGGAAPAAAAAPAPAAETAAVEAVEETPAPEAAAEEVTPEEAADEPVAADETPAE